MNNIFVLGSINMDLVFSVDRIPDSGETIKGNKFFFSPGGKGSNQAVACAKQGVSTRMIGSIGSDSLSKECLSSLVSYNVDCEHVTVIQNQTCGVAGIILENGDNRILTDSGANGVHEIKDIINIIKKHAKPNDVMISQLEIPLNIVEMAFIEAKNLGMKTVLNASPSMPLIDSFYSVIDLIIVNENEIEKLTDTNPNNDFLMEKSCKSLLRKGVKAVLLTLGERGSIYVDETLILSQNAFPVEVIDTTAAGDTFIGVFVTQLLKNKSVKEAMKYASAGASLAIQTYGAQVSIPTETMILEFLKGQVSE